MCWSRLWSGHKVNRNRVTYTMVFFGFGLWTTWHSKIWPGLLNPFTLIRATIVRIDQICISLGGGRLIFVIFWLILSCMYACLNFRSCEENQGQPVSFWTGFAWRRHLFNWCRSQNFVLNHRVYRVPGFLSSRPNWLPPPPQPQASVVPPFSRGGDTRERDDGEAIRTKAQTLWYSWYSIIPLRFTFWMLQN